MTVSDELKNSESEKDRCSLQMAELLGYKRAKDVKFKEFIVQNTGHKCKFGGVGVYYLCIDEFEAIELPPAPPVLKDNIETVCQSENLVFRSDITTRVTFNVFINGILQSIVAEHNRRSLITTLEVDGKIEKQWEGEPIEKLGDEPYTFYF